MPAKNASKAPETSKAAMRSTSNRRRLERLLREMLETGRTFPEMLSAAPMAQLPYRRVIE